MLSRVQHKNLVKVIKITFLCGIVSGQLEHLWELKLNIVPKFENWA